MLPVKQGKQQLLKLSLHSSPRRESIRRCGFLVKLVAPLGEMSVEWRQLLLKRYSRLATRIFPKICNAQNLPACLVELGLRLP
jgi:hypothetical protein